MAGAALFPQAAVRSAGAVRDFSDSNLIMRLTRGRSWIAVLGAMLVGIVALNLAAARLLLAHSRYLLIGAALSGVSLQIALSRLVRSRGAATVPPGSGTHEKTEP